jgi:DNA-binding ferritin-like protein
MSRIIAQLIYLQLQMRIYHWQTKSYARHKAFGKFYDSLGDLLDTFVETYQGIYGRVAFAQSLDLRNLEESTDIEKILNNAIAMLTNEMEDIQAHSDLLNIRDEMVGAMNHLRYLITLE